MFRSAQSGVACCVGSKESELEGSYGVGFCTAGSAVLTCLTKRRPHFKRLFVT